MYLQASTFCKLFDTAETWANYARAMNRRRHGSALDHNSFGRYLRRSCVYISVRGSALIGQMREHEGREIFVISHQAPVSHRDGAELLRKLACDKNTPAVLMVTADLVSMLVRLGFRDTGHRLTADFRGWPVEKFVLANF